MAKPNTLQEKIDHAWDLAKSMRKGMLYTNEGNRVVGRPMALVQDEFSGKLFFFSDSGTGKISQIREDSKVGVGFACPKDDNYVHFDGSARVVRDQATKDQYWSKFLKLWFPEGKEAANVVLLEISVENIEYWDSHNAVSQAIEAARALIKDDTAKLGENEEVSLA